MRRSPFLFLGFFLHAFAWPFEIAFAPQVFGVSEAFAAILAHAQEVLARVFPGAVISEEIKTLSESQMELIGREAKLTLDPKRDRRFIFYVARSGGEVVGYAVEDAVPGKWGPIHFLLSLDAGGAVKDVTVLEYRERRGKPVAERRFTKQFIGKKAGDTLAVQKDIQGVTGASISSKGVTNGIRKLVHVFKQAYLS